MIKPTVRWWHPSWKLVPVLIGVVFAAAACSQGVSKEEVAAKDQQIAALQAQVVDLKQDSTYWAQLTALMPPVELKSMTDHRAYMLPSGVLLALHFDDFDLKQAKNLNWVAWGVPGRFCKQDQERIEGQYGAGFTHFHDLMADTHGGKSPGVEGVWFVHIAVREFDAPWGPVKPGVDTKFMPTLAPVCSS